MKLQSLLTGILTAVTTCCAIAVTVVVVRKELGPPTRTVQSSDPTPLAEWKSISSVGHRIGPADAKVVLVEFADFECPSCEKFENGGLRAMRRKYPSELAVVFRHWPLDYHRLAYPAARAAECAAAQGRFTEFHDAAFAGQDSLGLRSFISFAREAGVSDTASFLDCTASADPIPAVEADIAAAKAIDASGTPTIAINGLLLHEVPDSARLDILIQAALASTKQTGGIATGPIQR